MRRAREATASLALVLIAGLSAVLGACGSAQHPVADRPGAATTAPAPRVSTPASAPAPASTLATTGPVARPRPVPTTSTTVPTAPPFRVTVATVTAADLPFTYHAGCPVGPAQLRKLALTYWGFDDHAHTGTIVVAASVTTAVTSVFHTLYAFRFPIRAMQPEDAFAGHDPASMAADNTSGFNCRDAVASGPPQWSAHAFGTAIDVNPVENPYIEGGAVQPDAGAAFLDRTRMRPGMSGPGTVLNRAFATVGWQWGGRWSATPDYQHFSADGK